MLVRVVADLIMYRYHFFMLAIIGHRCVAPLEWQHQQNQQGKETSHKNIMPDNGGKTIYE